MASRGLARIIGLREYAKLRTREAMTAVPNHTSLDPGHDDRGVELASDQGSVDAWWVAAERPAPRGAKRPSLWMVCPLGFLVGLAVGLAVFATSDVARDPTPPGVTSAGSSARLGYSAAPR